MRPAADDMKPKRHAGPNPQIGYSLSFLLDML